MTSREIAFQIELRLEALGENKTWFYNLTGISRATFSLWKSEKAFPSNENLQKVNKAIGTNFTVTDTKSPPPDDGVGLVGDLLSLDAETRGLLFSFLELAKEDQETAKRFLAFAVQALQSASGKQ